MGLLWNKVKTNFNFIRHWRYQEFQLQRTGTNVNSGRLGGFDLIYFCLITKCKNEKGRSIVQVDVVEYESFVELGHKLRLNAFELWMTISNKF